MTMRSIRIRGLAALAMLAIAAVGCGDDGERPVTPKSVERVFGSNHVVAPRSVALGAEESSAAARPYVPAIKPKGCPKDAVVFATWNGGNVGRKKTDEALAVMADVIREADVVTIQEVGTAFGAQTVAKLQDTLSRTGAAWDFVTSGPTVPKNSETEAYATLWKPSRAHIDRVGSSLVSELENGISREPFRTVFSINGKRVAVYSFHAVPERKNPEREVRLLAASKELADVEYAIVAGDFNLSAKKADPYFRKLGFVPVSVGKTTLKDKPTAAGEYRHKDFDHVYVKGLKVCDSGVVDFPARHFAPVDGPEALRRAQTVSDHLPVWAAIHF